ncbi:MAG: hypothetical protein LBG59_07610 [Candidatus Peribacteria bacterium]|jgi:hypothetical protein|nr:hypothetical protein [Candidatus Peribacteria bacterium]
MLAVVENMIKEANTSYNLSYDLMKRQLIGAGIDESLRPENLYSKLFNEGSGTTGLSDRFK